MNKALVLSVLLGVAALAGVLYTTQGTNSLLRVADYKYANDFKKYTQHFGKAYGHDEGFFRYTFYAQNKEIINSHNALYDQGKSTYFLGENELADMNLAEYKAKLLGYKRKSQKVSKVSTTLNTSVPTSVDWTTQGAVNPVKNQGQCGSCWAFSATSALESLNFLRHGQLVALSEQALVDCSGSYGNEGCNGGLMDQAFQYTAAKGLPTSASYPYTARDGTCKTYTAAFKNTGYQDVAANSDSALVAAIAQQPVSVAIEADTSAFQLYAGGILNDNSCGTQLDHGVTAVGYGSGFYKIRNSWGSSWGESGYVRLARTGDGAGMCGVQQDASYPTA